MGEGDVEFQPPVRKTCGYMRVIVVPKYGLHGIGNEARLACARGTCTRGD